MDAKERDGEAASEPANDGAKRLQLSIVRMKKLRSGVKGGDGVEDPKPDESTAPTSWI